MPRIHGFAPISNSDARLLILGSIPGKKSLEEHQYYALPHNAFWKIMGDLIGAGFSVPYENRLAILKSSGIALWDVLADCERTASSLDARIRNESANDFASFFVRHPHITRVCFNGSKAEQCFKKFVHGKQILPSLEYHRLPSTSPAHASMHYTDKLQAWRSAISVSLHGSQSDCLSRE